MICSSLKRLWRTTPPLGPRRAIVNGEVTFPLDYFSGGRSPAGLNFSIGGSAQDTKQEFGVTRFHRTRSLGRETRARIEPITRST